MVNSFAALGLSDARVEQLEKLGFEAPTEVQAQAIPYLLQGRDVVGQSQTGTGKTAAFSLPLLECIDLENPTVQALVLTPTRELAQQVAKAMTAFACDRRQQVATVYGGQSMDRQIRSLERGAQIVVGTPGRIIDLLERGKLHLGTVSWVVLDEADEMLSMGFVDDVKKIVGQTPDNRQTAFFSATMPRGVRDLIATLLNDPIALKVERPQETPSRIEQRIYKVPRGCHKIRALQPLLELEDPESALIFVRTKRSAAEVAQKLQAAGYGVDEYHGDLSQHQRERLVQRFRSGQVKIVVATDIAARGLDVADLSHVINYDLPDSVETYIHRIGRTGRAGKTGVAITLSQFSDRRMLRQIEYKVRQTLEVRNLPNRAQIEARRLERLREQLQGALGGERIASFLPVVNSLSDEYDPHAIAAAALQLVYDQNRRDIPSLEDLEQSSRPRPPREKPRLRDVRGRERLNAGK
ncbi:superfamily II DNA and RNA helicase [Rubidibacter lacunae KORDI 51-2]|uniref:RNA helicase n=1 Tax=Rubidibacter lacunae KORDI 51-2 TaxID=582515 RepID=U5DL35_9CHRO|nr:DEAD/DEAH box helicase [Rubidibacter lacunae]ERN41582.1 superfamily II DNA and RNA helicase [Rubidibacter lacunae KORDI 51-2]